MARVTAKRRVPQKKPRPAPWAWHEVMTNDTVRAKAFYERLFGWKGRSESATNQPYTVFSSKGQDVAGLMAIPVANGAPVCAPHWLAYLRVTSPDRTVAKATALGGVVVVPPMDIPGIGRFAVLRDPTGAEFAVYAAKA